MAPEEERELDEALTKALRDKNVGQTRVADVRVRPGDDADGEPVVFIEVVLKNPAGETWPVSDIWELRQKIAEVIGRLLLDTAWLVKLEPEESEELAP